MTEIFSKEGYEQAYPAGIERHFWHIARCDLIYSWLRRELDEDELVIDVGCGTGVVVNELRKRSVNVFGVEMGLASVMPEVEDHVRTETDLFDLDEKLKTRIRAVLLLDVLEHMKNRREFLERIHKELPNCKVILVTVPARMEIWSSYDEYWGHYLRYNRSGLEGELTDGGFSVKRSSYFFHWIYFISLLIGALGISRGNEFKPIPARGLIWAFHRFLGWLSYWEHRIECRRLYCRLRW